MNSQREMSLSVIFLVLAVTTLLFASLLETDKLLLEYYGGNYTLMFILGLLFLALSILFYGRVRGSASGTKGILPVAPQTSQPATESIVNFMFFLVGLGAFLYCMFLNSIFAWSMQSDQSLQAGFAIIAMLISTLSGLVALVVILLGRRKLALILLVVMAIPSLIGFVVITRNNTANQVRDTAASQSAYAIMNFPILIPNGLDRRYTATILEKSGTIPGIRYNIMTGEADINVMILKYDDFMAQLLPQTEVCDIYVARNKAFDRGSANNTVNGQRCKQDGTVAGSVLWYHDARIESRQFSGAYFVYKDSIILTQWDNIIINDQDAIQTLREKFDSSHEATTNELKALGFD
jgi:hypothetical protein